MIDDQPSCGWCRKGRFQVALLFQGTDAAYICDECAELCAEVARQQKAAVRSSDRPMPRGMPSELEEALLRLGKGCKAKDTAGRIPPPLPQ
jgi:ATP-dependent protease Clp ATPase subunit